MLFEYRYFGESNVYHDSYQTGICFAPDTLRKPVHFIGDLRYPIPFREAISALHDVVISDLRTPQRDLTAYKAWLESQEQVLLAEYMSQSSVLQKQVTSIKQQLDIVRKEKEALLAPYEEAKRRYFRHLYEHNRDWWFVLDPVITVHPDKIFFECFSQDESTYAHFSCSHDMFHHHGEFVCGTTNIDYSAPLYAEFQKIRHYKPTRLTIESGGFSVQMGNNEGFVEQKIDLPESWVRGFLQVSAAMSHSKCTITLHPMDLYNLCLVLRRRKERASPRSLRFELIPDAPVKLIFEPWGTELPCPRSYHTASERETIRIWGRRRLLTLERLIPIAEHVKVHLLGTGLPSFWQVFGTEWQYTLGLSGWTANDWSNNGHFDLFGPRHSVDSHTRDHVFRALCKHWKASIDDLTRETGFTRQIVESSLLAYTQAGRAVYDLSDKKYRLRELSREPLPLDRLRFNNEREEQAALLVAQGNVSHLQIDTSNTGRSITGNVKAHDKLHQVRLCIDTDEHIATAHCNCDFFVKNKLYRGPCVHILAVRMFTDQPRNSTH